jgi:hypothetical protein
MSKNYVFLSGACQKVYVTVSEHLILVNCINSFFFSGHKICQDAPLGTSESCSHKFSRQRYGGGGCGSSSDMQQDSIQCSIFG